MTLTIAAILLTLLVIGLAPRFGWWWGAPTKDRIGALQSFKDHISVGQSVLAIAGIAAAAGWYFVTRPDAAKLEFIQTVTPYPISGHRAILIDEIDLKNVGAATLKLDTTLKLLAQQITPLVPSVEGEFQQLNSDTNPRPWAGADSWGDIASSVFPVQSLIESQESEHLYYRVIVPCKQNLRVSVALWLRQPRTLIDRVSKRPHLSWIKQSFVDLTDICKTGDAQ